MDNRDKWMLVMYVIGFFGFLLAKKKEYWDWEEFSFRWGFVTVMFFLIWIKAI
jgi:hypothetical protein